jgi:anion-transporting  ArsA/GET3 family ATPase
VKEVLTVGKFLWEEDRRNYDCIVVDAAASGHVVGQLAAPEAINELVSVGLIRQQTGWMIDILSDPGRTGVCIVATPEEMPVNETIELAGRLERETNVSLAAVIVNRVLPELFGRGEEEVFEGLESDAGRKALADAIGPGAEPILDAARLAVTLRRTRAGHLEHLRSSIPAALPVLFVPELFTKAHGLRSTRMVAEALAAELGY